MSSKDAGLYSSSIKEVRYKTAVGIWAKSGTIKDAAFQHSLLCQTYLPYRNPGYDTTLWEHTQGRASLNIQCLKQKHPITNEFVFLGLPYGTKARLVIAYLNTEAIQKQSPVIEVERSISSFTKHIGLHSNGRNISLIKEQLAKIASSVITMNYETEDKNRSVSVKFALVNAYDLWFQKDDRQQVIWSNHIRLSDEYYNELAKHAVPLDCRAIGALKNNAMALDVYSWLAQRLHRIPSGNGQFVSWTAIKGQFGNGYASMAKFKQVFRHTLKIVHMQYNKARIKEVPNRGFNLQQSASPIEKNSHLIVGK